MNLTPKQFDHLADIMKEAGAIIFGGIAIGSVISEHTSLILIISGTVLYFFFIMASLYFKKRGENNG